MSANVEILEKTICYTNNYLYLFLGICSSILGIVGLFYFLINLHKNRNFTLFFSISICVLILGIALAEASIDKDVYLNRKIPYAQYIIMLTPETDMRYLIKNYTFDREIYSNVWQITERKEIINERRAQN